MAIRELVANAIIHQDFSITGVSPLVEVFSDRIEITNPGTPLINTHAPLEHLRGARQRHQQLESVISESGAWSSRVRARFATMLRDEAFGTGQAALSCGWLGSRLTQR